MECDLPASGRHVYRCRNRRHRVRGLPACHHVVHCECYQANDALFSTSMNDGKGLRAKPGDARPGYTCIRCRLQAVLGRAIDLDASPFDLALYESGIMYDIDVANSILASTATSYTQSAAAYIRFMETFMPSARYLEVDTPKRPPRRDPLFTLGLHQEYINSAMYTKGRTNSGGGVVASTALSRVSGFRHLGQPDGDTERMLRESSEFKRLQLGIKKRLMHNAEPKRTMTWETFCRWAARLQRAWRRAQTAVRRQKRRRVGAGSAGWRAELQRLRLIALSHIGQLHLVHVQVFGYTRGKVPFSLRYATWSRGLWTKARCAQYGVYDPEGRPMPHLRLLRDFQTKTFTSEWYEGVLCDVTATGHRLLDVAVTLRAALREAGLTEGGLFYHADGSAMTLASWQSRCLRPALRSMRRAGEPALHGETDLDFERKWSSWSLRRLCETHFSTDSLAAPMCPRDLKIGHSGWSTGVRVRGHISDRYRNWPLYKKIDATKLFT